MTADHAIQKCFRGMKPKPPTIRTEKVARRIAERLVAEINLDEFYWDSEELPTRIDDVTSEIMQCGKPATVFTRLWKQQPLVDDKGTRSAHPYGWEGIDDHCQNIADEIAAEILQDEITKHKRIYG